MEIQCRSCSLRCTPFCYVDPQECFNLSYYVDAQDFNLSYYVDPQECFNLRKLASLRRPSRFAES